MMCGWVLMHDDDDAYVVDGGELLLHVADDWGGDVAGARVGGVRGD